LQISQVLFSVFSEQAKNLGRRRRCGKGSKSDKNVLFYIMSIMLSSCSPHGFLLRSGSHEFLCWGQKIFMVLGWVRVKMLSKFF